MLLAVLSVCTSLAATPVFAWPALPQPEAADQALEAAVLVRDLRRLHTWLAHTRAVMQEVPVGRALLAPGPGEPMDTLEEITRLLAASTQPGMAVPAGAALLSNDGDWGLQVMVQVEPGFVARLHQVAGPWHVQDSNDGSGNINVRRGAHSFVARVGDDGWLRLATRPQWLWGGGGHAPPEASPELQGAVQDNDAVLFLSGTSHLAMILQSRVHQSVLRNLLQGVRAMALTLRTDTNKSGGAQLLIDAPALTPMGPQLQPHQQFDSVLQTLSNDVVGFASLEVPPMLRQKAPPVLQRTLGAPPYNAPDAVLAALGDLQGRVGWMAYDAPGDWAVSIELSSELDAAGLVPALQGWALSLAKTFTPAATPAFELEPFAGTTEPVLHLRPDTAVEGPYVAARGKTLMFVQQRSRLERLLDAHQDPSAALWQGPLTPQVRDALQPPRLLQSYVVLGGDGAWGDIFVWLAGKLQSVVREGSPPALIDHVAKRLPRWAALISYLWLRTYDVVLSAQVQDSLVTVQMTHSEI